jgi:hypothetical protein
MPDKPDRNRWERFKQSKQAKAVQNHLQKYQQAYIGGAIGFVTAASMFRGHKTYITNNNNITPDIAPIFNNKPVIKPIVNVVATMTAEVRGHPGNEVMCTETLEKFASQKRAALAEGVTNEVMYKHLEGLLPSINGRTFARTGNTSVRR